MKTDFQSLLQMDFVPLYEARAHLSEQIKKTQKNRKRIAVTINGRPAALLMSYPDFLELVKQLQGAVRDKEGPVIDFAQWKRDRLRRQKVSQSINALFKPEKLSRKGQKAYKRKTVRDFQRRS